MYGRPQNVASKFPINTFTQLKKKERKKENITSHFTSYIIKGIPFSSFSFLLKSFDNVSQFFTLCF